MYVHPNFKTKKAFKEAVASGETVSIFSPGPFPAPAEGYTTVEGPHYPEPHKWCAEVKVRAGIVLSVK